MDERKMEMPDSPGCAAVLPGLRRNSQAGTVSMTRARTSFEELIVPLEDRMMRTIWRIVRQPEEAEDTLQNALALIWSKLDRVSAHPNPQALILKICANAAVDTLRKRRSSQTSMGPSELDRLASSAAPDYVEEREIENIVLGAIGRLPRKQSVAILMRVLEDQSYAEIGRALGCREGTARTHVLRARLKLNRWLRHLRISSTEEEFR
jgi:RNA polymerase sigma-70 factor (ECF subfamily)